MLGKTLCACAILIALVSSSSALGGVRDGRRENVRRGSHDHLHRPRDAHVLVPRKNDPCRSLEPARRLCEAPEGRYRSSHARSPGSPRSGGPQARFRTKRPCSSSRRNAATRGLEGTVMKNGDTTAVSGIGIEAVPAYNVVGKRPDGRPFHPKGSGNGYIMTFGGTRVYVAGDTENTPEMKRLQTDRHRVPAHEPALYDDPRDGRGRGSGLQAEDPLPVPLRGNRRLAARGAPQGRLPPSRSASGR